MTLRWNIPDEMVGKHPAGELEAMIWACMKVDQGSITETNWTEWLWRVEFLRLMGERFGTTLKREEDGREWLEDFYPSADLLRSYIGLRTNATSRTRKEWVKNVMKSLEIRTNRAYELACKGQETPA